MFGHSDDQTYFSYIFGFSPSFLAHSSQNPWNFLSLESDIGAFCYVNEEAPKDGGWLPVDSTMRLESWKFPSHLLTS